MLGSRGDRPSTGRRPSPVCAHRARSCRSFSMRSRRPRARAAFTIVEMLIVIGIIALLFTLLVPMLTRTREMSRRLQCMGNLRGISVALLSFVADNGKFPAPAVDQRPD